MGNEENNYNGNSSYDSGNYNNYNGNTNYNSGNYNNYNGNTNYNSGNYNNYNGNTNYNGGNYNNYNGGNYNSYNVGSYYEDTTFDKAEIQSKIMTRSFLIVLAALIVTAISSTMVVTSYDLANVVYGSFEMWLLAEFVVVIMASVAINKRKTVPAAILFTLYSIINGLTLSVIFYAYDFGSIKEVFLLCAGMFAGMAIIGATTRINLTSIGSICMMALWGVILVSLANVFFLHSSGINLAMDYLGVLIFVGLTAYDTQKMKALARSGEISDMNIIALYCGMELYLDFINLFLRLLSIFGKKRN